MRIHIVIACFVLRLSRFYELSSAEKAVLALTIASVFSAELFNTAIEALCDKVSTEKSPLIKACKDCSAGAVLVFAGASVAVGITLFWNTQVFGEIARYYSDSFFRIITLIISIALSAVFVLSDDVMPKKHRITERQGIYK